MSYDYSVLNPATGGTAAVSSSASTTSATSSTDAADRFLKLLVTQLQNQDPLNPMDNAQITSQMAQINTVNGISQLNTTVSGLNSQFMQLQALTGASLVGRQVWLEGNSLQADGNGGGQGAFNLSSAADSVKVEVLSPSGQVVDTMQLGAETAGRHDFTWSKDGVTDMTGLTFRVTAKSGASDVPSTALMLDKVDSVGIDGDTLTLALDRTGDVPYSKILAVH